MIDRPWRLIFMGTPEFARPSLRALLEAGQEVLAVVTQPDRRCGRGRKLSMPPIKEEAQAWGVPVWQPPRVRQQEVVRALAELHPELIVVVAFGQLLPAEVLTIPSVGALNVHASLLPRHRGPAPINWAIIQGNSVTGVTIMWMDAGMDTGPIFLTEAVKITEADTAGSLTARLASLGAELLLQALNKLQQGEIIRQPQPMEGISYAPPLTRQMQHLDFDRPAMEVARWVRGLDPRPGAFATYQGKTLKVFQARVAQESGDLAPPGTVLQVTNRGAEVACGQGSVWLPEVQLAGSRRMPAQEFARGHLLVNQRLG
ncbi:MAG: methionyl-tRNA formyltransferase [Deltaproteobacteria bacterium]|nr:methionyl-tRNA formyltransferase [Deltaproteobacteria bacterium]MBW1953557.1 methionyl-tRNA formyltransferase [Deltaproteobacteria bacterium]MBW1987717.1 methionyl-tRNA formyltransferase [Deltaproteobacteria bacterium]MBW2135739.1 methionyl-tRNA formyltransferase [Deltaproteobacteria bacterium]